MGTRATIRADLRRDLRDEDSLAYIWTDAVLNRHIQHAVDLVQVANPRLASLLKTVPAAPQRVDLTADVPATCMWLEAVEYPLDRFEQCFIPFREEPGPKAYLLTASLPVVGEQLRVWYAGRYTVDDAASDMPVVFETAVLAGALAFACRDQAVDTVAKITPNGHGPGDYRALGAAARAAFDDLLANLRQRAAPPLWRPAWRLADEP